MIGKTQKLLSRAEMRCGWSRIQLISPGAFSVCNVSKQKWFFFFFFFSFISLQSLVLCHEVSPGLCACPHFIKLRGHMIKISEEPHKSSMPVNCLKMLNTLVLVQMFSSPLLYQPWHTSIEKERKRTAGFAKPLLFTFRLILGVFSFFFLLCCLLTHIRVPHFLQKLCSTTHES